MVKARKLHAGDSPSSYVDRSDESDDEDRMGILNSSQSSQSQSQSSIPLRKSEMGVIEEIYCENFMCHRKMVVKLGRNINFITGENGSGKSAIIAALQICLGASARTTHRGKSLKNLIRNNDKNDQPRSALVRITLLNDGTGSDAFRPEKFGKRIQVERLIRAEGTAEYRLKDMDGRIVSKSKADLEAMLDHLNIQIENPCAVLDQENAKLFLKGDPADKYKFFLQSTDLYKMRAVFAKIEDETKVRQEATLQHEQKKVELLNKARKDAEAMYNKAKSFEHLADELTNVKHRLAWSFVEKKERECKQLQVEYEEAVERIEAQRQNATRYDAAVEKLTAEQAELNESLEDQQGEVDKVQKQAQSLKEKQRHLRQPLQTKQAEKKQLERNIKQGRLRLMELEKEKQRKRDAYQKYVSSLESKQADGARKLQHVQAQLDAAQDEKNHMESQERVNFDAELDELNDKLDNCKGQKRDMSNEKDRLVNRIKDIQSQSVNRLAGFGNGVRNLNHLIEQNVHKFSAPPIGPLGMFIKLPDQFKHLALAVEVVLKNVLNSYLVANGRDKAVLDQLKQQAQCREASILIAPRSREKYSGLRVPRGELGDHAVVSIVTVEDPNVFNALIDVTKIESKVIYESRQDAEEQTLSNDNSGKLQLAPNISEVYLPNGDKFIVRKGNLAYIANKSMKHARVLTQDHTAELRDLEDRLDSLKDRLNIVTRDERNMIAQGDEMHKTQKRQEVALREVAQRVHHLQSQLNQLKSQQEQQSMDTSIGDTTMLDDEKNEIQYELNQFETKIAALEEELAQGNPEIGVIDEQLETMYQEEQAIQGRLQQLKDQTMAVYQKLTQATGKKMRVVHQLEQLERLVEGKRVTLEAMETQVAGSVAKASSICERVREELEEPAVYNERIKELAHRLNVEKAKFDNMDISELELDLEEKTRKWQQKSMEFDRFSENVERIAAMLTERKLKWEALRKEIAHRTSMGFNKYMEKRNFAGKLKFRHETQRLDISVVANDGQKTKLSVVNDMKQLSGGERSYTQVALLMALGECIECPFRVMDEFDVFMDSINRTNTLKLLIDMGKEEASKQFIFVTPNDLSSVKDDPMVKIQKLLAPRDR
ncbi:Aste57867_10483 [Aphanomyces stellatus]|uniref:Aste57867_10483 protein n=1 Tax=Aphanomyces stellatus TaxID=120398 RepID=A0A485KR32_9STRA|nr:hypothetical protein As57867_010443 [Aphanomyces stellatus]VFT87357.1 Aste57867_10483 [Aphanomyces stellatus]